MIGKEEEIVALGWQVGGDGGCLLEKGCAAIVQCKEWRSLGQFGTSGFSGESLRVYQSFADPNVPEQYILNRMMD